MYKPLTVLEPFGHEGRHRVSPANLARTYRVIHRRTTVTWWIPRLGGSRLGAAAAFHESGGGTPVASRR